MARPRKEPTKVIRVPIRLVPMILKLIEKHTPTGRK